MAYGLMNSGNKDLATKAQNIAVAVANGQMDKRKAISLLRSMDAMQKVKDYTDPKNEPPAFTGIHNDAIHNSGVFNAAKLPPAGWVSTPKDDAQRRRAIFDALHRI